MEICIRENFEISWYLEYKKNILNDLDNIRESDHLKAKRFLNCQRKWNFNQTIENII